MSPDSFMWIILFTAHPYEEDTISLPFYRWENGVNFKNYLWQA